MFFFSTDTSLCSAGDVKQYISQRRNRSVNTFGMEADVTLSQLAEQGIRWMSRRDSLLWKEHPELVIEEESGPGKINGK